MNFSKESRIVFIYYLFIVVYWAVLYFYGIKEQPLNYYYQVAEGFIPIAGGIWGIMKSRKWGFLKSKVGTAVFYISLGIFSWGVGQMLWSVYYNLIQHTDIPYPSLADVGFIMAIPFWTIGIIYLSRATGARFSLKHLRGKMILFALPLVAAIASYFLLIVIARGGVIDFTEGGLKLAFDIAYPLGDLIILTLSLVIYGLSFNYLGGRYQVPIIMIIGGFILMYFSDFSFSYTTTLATYYNGHWVDLMFPTVMMLLACGVNGFDTSD
jgi:hypothetical protein